MVHFVCSPIHIWQICGRAGRHAPRPASGVVVHYSGDVVGGGGGGHTGTLFARVPVCVNTSLAATKTGRAASHITRSALDSTRLDANALVDRDSHQSHRTVENALAVVAAPQLLKVAISFMTLLKR